MNIKGLIASMVIAAGSIAGCVAAPTNSQAPEPAARQIFSASHCGLTAPGLVYVEKASDLAALRQPPGIKLDLTMLDDLDLDHEHLVIVALGTKSTGGHGIDLASSELTGQVLNLAMDVREPSVDSIVTQALTTPCVVLAVPAAGWEKVVVRGEGLNTISRTR